MQVHRLLADPAFHAAARGVVPRRPAATHAAQESALLGATLAKVRAMLAKKGAAALVFLRRYALRLCAGGAGGGGAGGGGPAVSALATGDGVAMGRAAFDRLCGDAQWFLTPEEAQCLFAAGRAAAGAEAAAAAAGEAPAVPAATATADGAPACDVGAFFRLLRGRLAGRRLASAQAAFARLGGAASGRVHIDTVAASFNAGLHPDVRANKRSAADVTAEFLDAFAVQERTEARVGLHSQRAISAADWEGFYADVSAAMPDDALFDLVLFACWPAPGPLAGAHGGRAGAATGARAPLTAPIGGAGSAAAAGLGAGGRASIFFGSAAPAAAAAQAIAQARASAGAGALRARGAAPAAPPPPVPGAPRAAAPGLSAEAPPALEAMLVALRRHLQRVGPLSCAVLGGALRRHDADADGCVEPLQFRAALQETVLACAPPASFAVGHGAGGGGLGLGGAGAFAASGASGAGGAEHPLQLLDSDCEALYLAACERLCPAELARQRPALPLEAFHSLLRGGGALAPARRATVLALFQALDGGAARGGGQGGSGGQGGTGAVPIAEALLAFRAEGHPSVSAGRASVPQLYRNFQASFAEGFALADARGPQRRLGQLGAAAAEAYPGHGDGLVRLPFFEAWHEALACVVGECLVGLGGLAAPPDVEGDREFNLVAFSLWSQLQGGGAGGAAGGAGYGGGGYGGGGAASGARKGGAAAAANFAPASMLAKGDEGEAGLLSSMAKLGGVAERRGHGANASSAAFAAGEGPGSRAGLQQQQLYEQRAQHAQQAQQAQAGAPSPRRGGAESQEWGSGGGSGMAGAPAAYGAAPPPTPTFARRGGVAAAAAAASGAGGGGFFASDMGVVNGGSGTGVGVGGGGARSPGGGARGGGSAASAAAAAAAAAQAQQAAARLSPAELEVEAALRVARGMLQRRGARGAFRLVRALEEAAGALAAGGYGGYGHGGADAGGGAGAGVAGAGAGAPLGSLAYAMPPRALATVLRDCGLGLTQAQVELVARHAEAAGLAPADLLFGAESGGGAGGGPAPSVSLFPPLSAVRRDVARRAFAHVLRGAAAEGGAAAAAAARGLAPLASLQLGYASAHHPDVRGGKRAEAEVLREFLESFSGPSFVEGAEGLGAPAGAGAGEGAVAEGGFLRYHAIVGLFVAEDAAFATLCYDTWALFSARHDDGAAAGGGCSPQALHRHASQTGGGGGGGGGAGGAGGGFGGFSSVSEALGAGPPTSRALHPRGPGQDHPPASHYAGGHGVSGKIDLTMRAPGRGLERLW